MVVLVQYEKPAASLMGFTVNDDEESDDVEATKSQEYEGHAGNEVRENNKRATKGESNGEDTTVISDDECITAVRPMSPPAGYRRLLCAHTINNADCVLCRINQMHKDRK